MMVQMKDLSLDDIDYSDLERQYHTEAEFSTDSILVIDGIPKLDSSKEEKFLIILKKKLFTGLGTIKENGVYFPKEQDSGMGKGFMFVEFETSEQMKKVLAAAQGFNLDKNHKFLVFPFNDIERLSELYEKNDFQFTPEPFKERDYFKDWLSDAHSRDQFYILHGDTTSLYWNEKGQPAELIFQQNLADFMSWSPQGSYLATFHPQGIMLWCGTSLKPFHKFPHLNVAFIDFSPQEGYITTLSNNPVPDSDFNCFIWDAYTGRQLGGFNVPVPVDKKKGFWPLFKWSFDDRYIAYLDGHTLQFFDMTEEIKFAPSKKPIIIDGIQEFSWAPAKHHWIAYWVKESLNSPAKVVILELPSQAIIRSKNLVQVAGCQILWQNETEYLCFKVERHKTKKTITVNFELFRLSAKNIPVDMLEIKGLCDTFAWEPFGDRFALIETIEGVPQVQIYDMCKQSENGLYQVKHLKTLEKKMINKLFWSPKGRFIVLAGLDNLSGNLEFWNLSEANVEIMNTSEHYMATHLEWDPTGRYVITYQSFWSYQMENNYIIWDFKGTALRKTNVEKLKQIHWRPRPLLLLSAEKQKEIRKNLKEFSKIFEEEDARRANQNVSEKQKSRLKIKQDWIQWKKSSLSFWGRSERDNVIPVIAGDQLVEEWIEEVVEEREEEII